jgi:hypothetical protein
MTFWNDVKFAVRSLARTKGLTVTVVLTLALGIGANAAIFALVRGVLLRPVVNRDEDRLIYIRQSAPGIGDDDVAFSVPEIQDLRSRVKTLNAFGDFSSIGFTMVGLSEPREVRAGVVGGSYFDVMGLHPVPGRLLDMRDDGPSAAGAAVLTYRFWTTQLKSDPTVLGKTVRIRLAIGSQPRHLVTGVIAEGALMAAIGVVAGVVCGYVLARLAGSYFDDVRTPGALPIIGSAIVLLVAAVVASVLPPAQAARVDVMQALRSE